MSARWQADRAMPLTLDGNSSVEVSPDGKFGLVEAADGIHFFDLNSLARLPQTPLVPADGTARDSLQSHPPASSCTSRAGTARCAATTRIHSRRSPAQDPRSGPSS